VFIEGILVAGKVLNLGLEVTQLSGGCCLATAWRRLLYCWCFPLRQSIRASGRGRCLDIIKQILIVDLEISVFEFPCLAHQNHSAYRDGTPSPYGFGLPSSVFRTLWKSYLGISSCETNVASYLFNCRTKLAKLECLKCRGRTLFVNSFCWARGHQQLPCGGEERME